MAAEGIYLSRLTRPGDVALAAPSKAAWQHTAGRGNGVFAISPACRRRRRIALSRGTPHQPDASDPLRRPNLCRLPAHATVSFKAL